MKPDYAPSFVSMPYLHFIGVAYAEDNSQRSNPVGSYMLVERIYFIAEKEE